MGGVVGFFFGGGGSFYINPQKYQKCGANIKDVTKVAHFGRICERAFVSLKIRPK